MKKTLTILTLTISTILTGQNLVPDGSFELDTACPQAGNVNYNLYWTNPTAATPDYFDTCSSAFTSSVPNNYVGSQSAFGTAYVGIITKIVADYREYVQVHLIDSLQSGVSYCVSYYVSLAGKSSYATPAPQLYFSNTAITSTLTTYLSYTPQISDTAIVSDTTNWTLISGTYTAIGGEKYITIGNFHSDANTPSTLLFVVGILSAYYYVDNVSVIDCGTSNINERTLSSTIILFPNPTKQKATLDFSNPTKDNFTLTLYDIQGRLTRTINNITADRIEIEKQNLSSGFYFYRLQSDKKIATGKLIIE